MQLSDCYFLGNISKRHGLKGHVTLFLDTDEVELYQDLKNILILRNGTLVPFFISESSFIATNKLRILLEKVEDSLIDQLLGNEVYLPISHLPKLEGNKFYYFEVVGYNVIDHKMGGIGFVKKIIDESAQGIFAITHGEKEILVPIHDQFIDRIDRENKTIHIKSPEGLIELYLS